MVFIQSVYVFFRISIQQPISSPMKDENIPSHIKTKFPKTHAS